MKRIVAIALIAIIALTAVSTAGVMAASKKPTDTKVTPVPLKYQPGKTYTFLPNRYNVHSAEFLAPRLPILPSSQHTEYASGATAYTSISEETGQAGSSYAFVGMQYKLNGITALDLSEASKTCTVTYEVSYVLTANGKDGYASISYTQLGIGDPGFIDDVSGQFGPVTKVMTKTVTKEVPLNYIFKQDTANNQIQGSQVIIAFSDGGILGADAPTYATASVVVNSISLTFN